MAELSINFRRPHELDRSRIQKQGKGLDAKSGLEAERLDSGIDSMPEGSVSSVTEQMDNLSVNCESVEEAAPCQNWTQFRSEDGDTFLNLAILHNCPEIAIHLVRSNTSVIDLCNSSQQCPLHLSVIVGLPEVTRELVQAGADPESTDYLGNTALHLACEQENLECMNALLDPILTGTGGWRQDLERCNYSGYTCLHIAVMRGRYEAVQKLLDSGANVNTQEPNSGRTPLHLAVEFQRRDVVQLLIECGADANRLMYNSCTAFHLTAGRPDLEIQNQLFKLTNSSLIPLYESSDSESEADWDIQSDCDMPLDYDDLQIGGHSLH
ncbi:NF-kappa-B inhibitor alpha-like [Hypanus sabinus]|uniref:NF-kappa-B inhibitor alpha-like n=1 Tax=Hypanus sabinus TaxID=79690 RepID=UPI0028C47270|nr:NF-kappa-B inhibitor alpha-like [Hypanus sabinus]